MPSLDLNARLNAFLTAATRQHHGKYDYGSVPSDFVNAHTPVTIGCPDHGDFRQTPNEHRRGQRCPDCAGRRGSSPTARRQQFIANAHAVHGRRFSYADVNYVDQHTSVTISCKLHGAFQQRPDHHIDSASPSICPGCADQERKKSLAAAWKRRPRPRRGEEGHFVSAA